MELSNRLKEIAGMVTPGNIVCDVGTDHAYLAIYLIESRTAPYVIAMDVAEGPLARAERNIKVHGLSAQIETRLSDGVEKLGTDEAQTVIMAGMGGILICDLLERGKEILSGIDELIVSPHTDAELVRKYLAEHGYCIRQENMILEEGKYYIMIRAVHGEMKALTPCEYRFGRELLQNRSSILREYLQREYEKLTKLSEDLREVSTENAMRRRKELAEEIQCVKEGLAYYGM